jgi:predicted glycosyltransferase
MYFAIRCDAVPGKLLDLDTWLKDRGIRFWTTQPGVESVEIFSDVLVGYPERTLMVEVKDFAILQRILTSPEHARFRNELLTYGTDVQSQILERIVHEKK